TSRTSTPWCWARAPCRWTCWATWSTPGSPRAAASRPDLLPSPDGRGIEPRRAEGDPLRRKGEGSAGEVGRKAVARRLTPTERTNPSPFRARTIAALSCAQALSPWERVSSVDSAFLVYEPPPCPLPPPS